MNTSDQATQAAARRADSDPAIVPEAVEKGTNMARKKSRKRAPTYR